MSVDLRGDGVVVGLVRKEQFSGTIEVWPDVLRAYRRYRTIGMPRSVANVLTIGYADGLRSPVLTVLRRSVGNRARNPAFG